MTYQMRPGVAQGHKRATVNATDCGFDLQCGKEVKHSVEFRHSRRIRFVFFIRSVRTRFRRKVGNGMLERSVLALGEYVYFAYPAVFGK